MAVTWTTEKNAEFRAMRATTPVAVMAAHFGTTPDAIHAHSRILDIKFFDRKTWEPDEVAELIRLDDARESVARIARALGRTPGSVQWKLEDLGRKSQRRATWDKADEVIRAAAEALGRAFTGKEAADLALNIDRPLQSVRERIKRLGFEIQARAIEWTDEDINSLRRQVAEKKTLKQASVALNRSESSTRAMADRLGLVFAAPATDDGDLVVKIAEVFSKEPKASIRSVAAKLDLDPRRVRSLCGKAGVDLTVRVRTKPVPVTRELLLGLAGRGLTLTAAAKSLNRDYRTLKPLAESLGVLFPAYERPAAAPNEVRPSVRRALPVKKVGAVKLPRLPKVSKPAQAKSGSAKGDRLDRRVPSHPAAVPVRKVEVRLDPAPLRPADEVKTPARPSFGRIGIAAKSQEVLDQASVDEAVRRFIAARGVTKVALSPVDEAVSKARRLGYSVTACGESRWRLDGRLEIASAEDLIAFVQAREARANSLMTAT